MLNNRLNETMIGSAKVIVDILPKGKVIPNTRIAPTSITIHMTGNIGATARNNHNYMKNCNKNGNRIASWHFTVDDKEIYQAQSTNYKTYHAGCSAGNNGSIGIEICMFNDAARQKKAYDNAIALVKILMSYHKFSISQVKRHYDWTRKHCPAWLIEGKWGYTWSWFKNQLNNNNNVSISKYITGVYRVTADTLNVRKGPGASYDKVGSVPKGGAYTIVKVDGNWGFLKSGLGWIHLGYTEKVN